MRALARRPGGGGYPGDDEVRDQAVRHVYSEGKFVFCRVPKSASSGFLRLINELDATPGRPAPNYGLGADLDAVLSFTTLPAKNMTSKDVRRADGWTYGAFLRDPMERFASHFLSKCLHKSARTQAATQVDYEDHGESCPGFLVKESASVEETLDTFERYALSLKERRKDFMGWSDSPMEQVHMRSQANHIEDCMAGAGAGAGALPDVIGYLSHNQWEANRQVREMLLGLNVSAVRAAQLADKHFSAFGRPSHGSMWEIFDEGKGMQNAWMRMRLYRNEAVRKAVRDAYAADYALIEGVGRGEGVRRLYGDAVTRPAGGGFSDILKMPWLP